MWWRREKLEFLLPRERFIPVQIPALVERIASDAELSEEERCQFRQLARLLQARFHFEFLELSERLKELFDPFNPDRDTQLIRPISGEEIEDHFEQFRRCLDDLLIKSNYTKLSRKELVRCLEAENPWGVQIQVDLSRYTVIDFYYRGVHEFSEPYQPWYAWQPRPRKVRRFSRIVVLVRFPRKSPSDKCAGDGSGPTDRVLVKLFKDVRLDELKMTSPEIRIRIRFWDKLQIGLSIVITFVTSVIRLVAAAAINPVLFFSVLAGCVTAAAKAVHSFITCRIRYMERLGANLYHKLLASNLPAIARLCETAEAEEVKEALIAYYILYKYRDRDLMMTEADQLAEAWLTREFGLPHVDFEIDDALRKLREKNLLVERTAPPVQEGAEPWDRMGPAEGVGPEDRPAPALAAEPASSTSPCLEPTRGQRIICKVYDLPSALRRLDEWWDNYFQYANLGSPEQNHVAEGKAPR
jgi:hypothetical protein